MGMAVDRMQGQDLGRGWGQSGVGRFITCYDMP